MSYTPGRPGSVMTAAVLLLIYGSLMLVCGLCGGAGQFIKDPNDPMGLEEFMAKELPAHQVMEITQAVSNVVIALTMILAALGILQLMPAARIAAYCATIYEIVWAVVHSAYTVIFVFPVTERMFAQVAQNQPPMPFDFGQLMTGGMWVGVTLSFCICLGFCVPIILCLSTKSARAAFAWEYTPEFSPHDRLSRFDDLDDDDSYKPRPPGPRSPGDTGFSDRSL